MDGETSAKAAWACILFSSLGSSDIVSGWLVSGRKVAVDGIDDVVGPVLNVLEGRIQSEPKENVSSLLCQVRDLQIATQPHEQIFFTEIVKQCTDWPSSTSYSTIIKHQFNDIAKLNFDVEMPEDGLSWTYHKVVAYEGFFDNVGCWLTSIFLKSGLMRVGLRLSNEGLSESIVEKLLDDFFAQVKALYAIIKESSLSYQD